MKDYQGYQTRKEWVSALHKICYPVIKNASDENLKSTLPLSKKEQKRGVAYLEAIGRTLAGIAPWLELENIIDQEEKTLQAKYREMALKTIDNATNKNSKDYAVWWNGSSRGPDQPIVDAAYFASALIKAENQLWKKLDQKTKKNVIDCLKETRKMRPNISNWLLFAAMVEACIYKYTGECDSMRVEYALMKHYEWYKGDGVYGDGDKFAWDYYNSYVIQPMLEEITSVTSPLHIYPMARKQVKKSISRYCEVQERLIAPDGSYPFLGRSITYRMAAFHALSHCALRGILPKSLPANQVRCALDKVLRKAMSASSLFDENGWLTKGLYGKQESLANYYTNTASLYICSVIFLPLGLSPKNKFWKSNNAKITWEKIWSGEDMPQDHSCDD